MVSSAVWGSGKRLLKGARENSFQFNTGKNFPSQRGAFPRLQKPESSPARRATKMRLSDKNYMN